jgi:hypothetical protein
VNAFHEVPLKDVAGESSERGNQRSPSPLAAGSLHEANRLEHVADAHLPRLEKGGKLITWEIVILPPARL